MGKKHEFWRRLVAAGAGSGNSPNPKLASEIAKRMGLNLKREAHRRIVRAIQQKLARDE